MKKNLKRFSISLLLILVSGLGYIFFSPKPPLLDTLSFSKAVYDRNGNLLRLTLNQEDKFRLYTPLIDISPELIKATLLQEDHYFYQHPGVNPLALGKAIWQSYVIKQRKIGASTITMQLARIRYHIYTRSITGKIRQIFKSLQLERHYSKEQILEAYLNLAPYGFNIEGIGAASHIYFNKTAKKLSLPETLTLTVMPQNPVKRKLNTTSLTDARMRLFSLWTDLYPVDNNKLPLMKLPLSMQSIHDLSFRAPHFVNQMLQQNNHKSVISTTLDIRLQNMIEQVTSRYVERKKNIGVTNAAVLIVDSRTMGVLAELGSVDFYLNDISGQINGTHVKRSPGSTLKPFIYALALDQGIIHPASILKDVPQSFGPYNPDNFDYRFAGPLTAEQALILSRNIPAVYLANQLNKMDLHQLLVQTEVSQLKPPSFYGLSIALGGVDVTMQELAGLYAMLANQGLWYPLKGLDNTTLPRGKRLLSPEASFLVLDMLSHTPRPSSFEHIQGQISFKTGTSSGYRDAWTAGIAGPYVVVVWLGHFDQQSNKAFVGKSLAAPLFFDIIQGLIQTKGRLPSLGQEPRGMNLVKIDVCKASGLLPTPLCPEKRKTWFIPGKSPIKTDNIFREVAINPDSGLRTCHIDSKTKFAVYEFWSSDLLSNFKQAGIVRQTAPPYEKNCMMRNSRAFPPQIVSPREQLTYVIQRNHLKDTLIPFSVIADGDVKKCYWFLNNQYLKRTDRDKTWLWLAKPGQHLLRVVDDHGQSSTIQLTVKIA